MFSAMVYLAPVEPARYAPPLDPVGDLTGAIGI